MPAEWGISHWPSCDFHVFLSHCAEDRDRIIVPVYQALEQNDVFPWIDRHQYPPGRDPLEILREEILRCRHVAFFLTERMLRQARGWSAAERSYAEVVQRALCDGAVELCHVVLPLVFVDKDHAVLNRSVWQPLLSRAVYYDGSRRSTPQMVKWATLTITDFVRNEVKWGVDVGERIEADQQLSAKFATDANLFDRLIAASPPPV